MILVYTDSTTLDNEWLHYLFDAPIHLVHSIEEYESHTASKRYAFTMHRLHCDHDENCAAYRGFEDKINKLAECSDYVFSFESELHNYHWQMWERCHHPNVYWVLPGQVNDSPMNGNIIFWGDWFKTTTHVYKQLPNKLAEIVYSVPKPRMFDALLGVRKPHRDFVYNAVKDSGLENQFIITYGGSWNDDEFYAKDYFEWEPDCVPLREIIGTADAVMYNGVYTGLSRVIPIRVFNDTAYSIIAETDYDNTLSFFSEKTAKPMIARRLFVAFTGYKFLHNLRNQGFLTFCDVIDESYDLIKNDRERYAAAFEQVKKLCAMDQQEVYDQISGILDHNYRHIMQTDWTQFAAGQIKRLLTN